VPLRGPVDPVMDRPGPRRDLRPAGEQSSYALPGLPDGPAQVVTKHCAKSQACSIRNAASLIESAPYRAHMYKPRWPVGLRPAGPNR
jgi:hypothetical protein